MRLDIGLVHHGGVEAMLKNPVRFLRQGKTERVGHGLYTLQGRSVSGHQTLVEASKRVPHGVVCLLSVLRFHELTTPRSAVSSA